LHALNGHLIAIQHSKELSDSLTVI